jgi:hypothetical protein
MYKANSITGAQMTRSIHQGIEASGMTGGGAGFINHSKVEANDVSAPG